MKITTHRCDLCGAKRPEKKMSKLHVPLTDEERALRTRTENQHREVVTPIMHPIYGWIAPDGGTSGVMTYDICRECVDGILAARFREVRRKLALGED